MHQHRDWTIWFTLGVEVLLLLAGTAMIVLGLRLRQRAEPRGPSDGT
jgi:hypothetical protein